MNAKGLTQSVAGATKWSGVTEVCARLISPITNMILARLLIPEVFGVVQTLTLVVSFAEIFTDAGFQKYLVQREFKNEEDLNLSTNVAFWTNLGFSVLLWLVIALCAEPIAGMVGSQGHGTAVAVMSLQIPMLAFSSIQMARYRRDMDFKSLFFVRMVTSLVPLVVTVPLAVWLRSYWALVAGNLCKDLINAVLLTWRSKWKPGLSYQLGKLKDMLSFSVWTIVENVFIWLTANIGTFIVGIALTEREVGLYKTTISTVNGYMNVISATVMQVLFSGLSRCQNDEKAFRGLFFRFQRMTALLVIPLGFGTYVFRRLVVAILLGDQWTEVSDFLGLWSLTSALAIVLSSMNSEAFRSKGRPRLSVLGQILQLVVLVPVLLVMMDHGFYQLSITRSLLRLEGIAVSILLLHCAIKIPFWQVLKNVYPSFLSAMIMAAVGMVISTRMPSLWGQVLGVAVCVAVYGACMLLLPAGRRQLLEVPVLNKLLRKCRIK